MIVIVHSENGISIKKKFQPNQELFPLGALQGILLFEKAQIKSRGNLLKINYVCFSKNILLSFIKHTLQNVLL
jgi:hypothetical protein